jgi:hypothetical protein
MTVQAATYYVDFANGSNANAGTTTASPWKNCPGDSLGTLVPATAKLNPGDMVIFKGGTVYRGSFGITASGVAGATIIYDGNSTGTFGTGSAVIDGDSIRYNGIFSRISSPTYIVVRNFEIRNMAYNASAPWASGSGISIYNASHCTVANCFIHNIGYWNNDGSVVPAGSGVTMDMASNCLVSGCNITKTGMTGVELDGAQNCVVSRDTIHDYITWGVDLAGDYQLCTGNDVCDNCIHDLYYYDTGFYGVADPPHTDFVFIRMGSGQRPVKNIVERNLFYNNYSFTDFGGTAMTFLSFADSTTIRNNVYINPHSYFAAFFGWTSSGTKFYSNTIYAPRSCGCLLQSHGSNDIRDNIIIASSELVELTNDTDRINLTCDYNMYTNGTGSQSFVLITPYTAWTFAGWEALGYDAHSHNIAAIANFKFDNTAGYPTACQSMNLQVEAASPVIGAGIPLPGFSTDKDSIARPASGAWDVGAYEHQTTAVHSSVTQTGPSQRGALVAEVFSIEQLHALLNGGNYMIFDLAGRSLPAGSVERNMLYLLRNEKLGTALRIMVTR